MVKRRKQPDRLPSKAYLVSFGDTMTTLLAFFIVLNSLAEEQTGANLYSGTGSFVRALDSFGLQGRFTQERSATAVPRDATSPLYMVDSFQQDDPDPDGSGPDEEDDAIRIIDREQDEFTRFMLSLEESFDVEKLSDTTGEVTFDYFNGLPTKPPYLTENYAEAVRRIAPLMYLEPYEVQIIVWATTPSPTAWSRAASQAQHLVEEISDSVHLSPQQRKRISGVGRAWIDSEARRPVLSVVVRKVKPAE